MAMTDSGAEAVVNGRGQVPFHDQSASADDPAAALLTCSGGRRAHGTSSATSVAGYNLSEGSDSDESGESKGHHAIQAAGPSFSPLVPMLTVSFTLY